MASYYGYWGRQVVEEVGDLTVSGANTLAKAIGRPADIKRLIFVTTTALTGADAVLTVGKRNLDGTGSVTHDTYTFPFSGSALNDVHEILVGESLADDAATVAVDGTDVHDAGNDLLEIEPPEEFFITSDGGPTAGAVKVFVQYQEQGLTGDRYDATKLAKA